MIKHLVTIEFRYNRAPKSETDWDTGKKTITIGVYDSLEDAIENGNKALEALEEQFPLNKHWNRKERFSKNGGCFGSAKTLITNIGYLITPFDFYAKITDLKYDNVEQTIIEVLKSVKEHKEYNLKNQ